MTHTCNLPEERPFYEASEEAEDFRAQYWRCLKCRQTWRITEDRCYECGRSNGIEWVRVAGTVFIGPYEEPLPGGAFPTLPEISAHRGGIRFWDRSTEPPAPVIIGKPSDHKELVAMRERAAARERRVLAVDEGDILTASGWCAPRSTLYGMDDQ